MSHDMGMFVIKLKSKQSIYLISPHSSNSYVTLIHLADMCNKSCKSRSRKWGWDSDAFYSMYNRQDFTSFLVVIIGLSPKCVDNISCRELQVRIILEIMHWNWFLWWSPWHWWLLHLGFPMSTSNLHSTYCLGANVYMYHTP